MPKVAEVVSKPVCEGLQLLVNHDATIRFRVAEIQSLGRIYFKLCECSLLTTSDISDLIEVLSQSQDIDTVFIHLLVTLLHYMNSLAAKLPLHLTEENTFEVLGNKLDGQSWKVGPAQALATLFFKLGVYSYYTLGPMREESSDKANSLVDSMTKEIKDGALHFAIMYLFTNQERAQAITQPLEGQEQLMSLCKRSLWKAYSGKPSQALLIEGYLCEPEFKEHILSCLGFSFGIYQPRYLTPCVSCTLWRKISSLPILVSRGCGSTSSISASLYPETF
ncbi:hypothetical protein DSO57_1038128 [Entomophthora muscae]|uniref:Uncharacterized protein n=1 Tax=Entomophthora muscae TaxID=34485 RepID=A0ACC2T9G7_9FUNG|nr:hypothetical protein DSO57_1038128 [Entomophthora muscae]